MVYKNALIVDDDMAFRLGLGFNLEDIGIMPDLARSYKEAADMAMRKPYELCISDGLEGEWLPLHEKLSSLNPNIRFILLSCDYKQLDAAKQKRIEAYDKSQTIKLIELIKSANHAP